MNKVSLKVQLELQKENLMHTLDFLIDHYTGYFILDNYDAQKHYYIQQKAEVENLFAQGDLATLNSMLKKMQKKLYLERDENYPGYMERVTASPLVMYKELSKSIQRICTQKVVSTETDALEVEFLINIYKNTTSQEYDIEKLKEYVERYRTMPNTIVSKNILQTEDSFGTMLWDDSLSKWNPSRKISPNRINWIELNESGQEEFGLTYLVAGVDGSNGPIYSIKGKGAKITFHWAHDTEIVIHTSSKYKSLQSISILKTKHSTIHIKYVYDASLNSA
jgi:hypothetical protein